MIAGWAGLGFLCVVLIVKRPDGWHTGLFIWGVAIGLVGVANEHLTPACCPS
jgi:hypothetical protein